jgi:hypothetical protein
MRFWTVWASVLGIVFMIFASAGSANAQATRTWVSGVGDDANPCSRTAPCKTFAGAISKTAAGGEINVLDPGGFGAVTITKSITISSEGFEAGVLVSGTNAIVISAGVNDTIILRGLDIEGLGTGLAGIKFLAGGALYVEKCNINHFTQNGIEFAPNQAGAAFLFVSDSNIRHNTQNGILIKPASASAPVKASVSHSQVFNNGLAGVRGEGTLGGVNLHVSEVVTSGNVGAGIASFTTGTQTRVMVMNSVSSNNGTGLNANGAAAVLRIGQSMVFNNGTNAAIQNGATMSSYNNNQIDDNGVVNAIPTIPLH